MSLVVRKDSYVVHAPLPSPFLNFRLMRGLFSLGDQMLMTMQRALEFRVLSHSQDPKVVAEILEIGRAVSVVLQKHDEDSPQAVKALDLLQTTTRELIENQLAHEAWQRKLAHAAEIKRQAQVRYFNEGGFEILQKIDIALADAQGLSFDNYTTIDAYWKLAAKDPWRAERHQQIEMDIFDLFYKPLEEADYSVQCRSLKKSFGTLLKNTLNETAKKAIREFDKFCDKITCRPRLVRLDYIAVKGRLLIKPMIRRRIREILGTILQSTPDAVQKLAMQKYKHHQQQISELLAQLNSLSCCTNPEIIKKEYALSDYQDMLDIILKTNLRCRENVLEDLERLRAFPFEMYLEDAIHAWGYDTQELERTLNEETAYDKLVIEILRLQQDDTIDVATLEDPVEFLVQKMKKRDADILSLLESREPLAPALLEGPVENRHAQT